MTGVTLSGRGEIVAADETMSMAAEAHNARML